VRRASNILKRLEPVLLLLASGFCIGLIFPLSKLAAIQDLPPLLYTGATAAGASLVLWLIAWIAGAPIVVNAETARYGGITGAIGFAIPFGTMLVVIPHLGSAIPAILQSLAPILTLGIVSVLGVERPSRLRVAGLIVGMIGAMIILAARNGNAPAGETHIGWYLLALVTPISLAAGNVFRTTHWPKGHGPLPLAMLTLAGAAAGVALVAAVLSLAGLVPQASGDVAAGLPLIATQSVAIGVGYAFFFRLQQVGGPIYLSQISYVNTAVGVAFAVLLFAEQLSVYVWLSIGLILAGVAMVNHSSADAK
jgi:drug/metabolite transporter (DMT)-like permease